MLIDILRKAEQKKRTFSEEELKTQTDKIEEETKHIIQHKHDTVNETNTKLVLLPPESLFKC